MRRNIWKHWTVLDNGYPRRFIRQTFSWTSQFPSLTENHWRLQLSSLTSSLWTNQKDLGPTKHQDMLLSPLVSKEHLQGPYCTGGQNRGGLLYPLRWLPCHLCGTSQDLISLPQWAQTGSQKCQILSLCCCWTCLQQLSGHTIAWDEALVIDSNLYLHPRCALDAWHIRSQPHPLNRERGPCTHQPWHQKCVDVAISRWKQTKHLWFLCVCVYCNLLYTTTCWWPLLHGSQNVWFPTINCS